MRTFKIEKDWNGIGCNIYQKATITIQPGITILVGCNGIGKTTLMKQLQSQLKKSKTPVIAFDNLHDGGHNARASAMFHGDYVFAGTSMCASEGENIHMNLTNFAKTIAHCAHSNKDANEIWIFMDAVDSGLSVDNIVDLKDFCRAVLEREAIPDKREIYIIISANEYEMARGEACFDVLRGKYRKFGSYEAYRNFILKTREHKNKRIYKD